MSETCLRLRMYNIPADKSEQQLLQELGDLIPKPIRIQLVMKNESEHAGYAFLEFDTQTDYDTFVIRYPKLRHDIVIYKNLSN